MRREAGAGNTDIPVSAGGKTPGNMFYERNDVIRLCHGSGQVVTKPFWGGGEKTNDYGPGFYTVSDRNIELAKEWACSPFNTSGKGFVNTYTFETGDMRVLNLDRFDIVYWIVLTATHRSIDISQRDLEKLQSRYLIDVSQYDCVYGWRCDDTYSRIISGFFEGNYSAEAIREATKLGHLQEQFVLISERSFERIRFETSSRVSDFASYRKKFDSRKIQADAGLRECRNRNRAGKYIDDYMAEI